MVTPQFVAFIFTVLLLTAVIAVHEVEFQEDKSVSHDYDRTEVLVKACNEILDKLNQDIGIIDSCLSLVAREME